MQRAVHPRSSSNGCGRRRGERDVGTRAENKSQSGKSNASRLTSAGIPLVCFFNCVVLPLLTIWML